MKPEEFREQILPLTEKEIRYREHPEISQAIYRSLPSIATDPDGILRFMATHPNDNEQEAHGRILPAQGQTTPHPNLTISKQTRYSVIPLHRHAYVEMNYVYRGKAAVVFSDRQVSLQKGDICILDSNVVHTILPAKEPDIILDLQFKKEYFTLNFIDALRNSGVIAQFLSHVISDRTEHMHHLIIHTKENPGFENLFEYLVCEYLDPKICSVEALDSYIRLLFILLARSYQSNQEEEYNNTSWPFLTQVLQYIEDHCSDCTLTETAAHFGYNPNYLTSVIRNQTGYSFRELVYRNRLTKAGFLLANSSMSIENIANDCGWHNLNQFYKIFKSELGCTPNQYRKKNKADE